MFVSITYDNIFFMEILNLWWVCAIAIVISFGAVFLVTRHPKWPSPTMYGLLIGTGIGLISLFFVPSMTALLFCFAIGTFVGFVVDVIRAPKK